MVGIHYKNGQHFGTSTSFRPDGSKSVVQRYGLHGAEGEASGYFPSGALMYRGQHRNNAQVGTWVWYNEDGSVRSRQEHPDPGEAGTSRTAVIDPLESAAYERPDPA